MILIISCYFLPSALLYRPTLCIKVAADNKLTFSICYMQKTEMWHCISNNEPIKISILLSVFDLVKDVNNYAESLYCTSCPFERFWCVQMQNTGVVLYTVIFNKNTSIPKALIRNVLFNFSKYLSTSLLQMNTYLLALLKRFLDNYVGFGS